jgi:hypothetical protein
MPHGWLSLSVCCSRSRRENDFTATPRSRYRYTGAAGSDPANDNAETFSGHKELDRSARGDHYVDIPGILNR